jgi:hypothetical protein
MAVEHKITHILKHKNIDVAYLWIEEGNVLDVNEIKEPEHLPYKYTENSVKNIKLLNNWIAKRGIPFRREDYDSIMEKYRVNTSSELTVLSNGINLTDHYWLCEKDKDKKWENVNFLDNKFSIRIGEILPELTEVYEEFINPDFSSNGRLKKFWIIDGEKRVLCKDGSGDVRQEPFNEKIASDISERLKIKNVKYELSEFENKYYSKCECMIDRDLEYVNAFIVYLEGENTGNRYEDYIKICEQKGIKNAREEIDKMIMLDYIIRNTDRHVGNFGILRNAETLKWEKIAPVFDNGNSFWHDAQGEKYIDGKTKSQCRSFLKSNEECILLVKDRNIIDLNKIKEMPNEIYNVLKLNKNMEQKRIEKIIKEYNYRIENIDKIRENI